MKRNENNIVKVLVKLGFTGKMGKRGAIFKLTPRAVLKVINKIEGVRAPDNFPKVFNYRAKRLLLGYSAKRVCELTGIAAPHLSQLERGVIVKPSFDMIDKLYTLYFIKNEELKL